MRVLIALACLVSAGLTVAQVTPLEGFVDPELNARYRDLIHTIRCMKCQNQSIAESPIDSAADVRRQVREMIAAGRTDAEIRDYLAARYGDFINYDPPLKPSTWLLWAGPGLMLLGGGVVFARILRARAGQPLDEELG